MRRHIEMILLHNYIFEKESKKKAKISRTSLADYENSSLNKLPGYEAIRKIAKAYNVPYEFLLEDDCNNEKIENSLIGNELNLSDTAIEVLKKYNTENNFLVLNSVLENVDDRLIDNLFLYNNLKSIKKLSTIPIENLNKRLYNIFKKQSKDTIDINNETLKLFNQALSNFNSINEHSYTIIILKESFEDLNEFIKDLNNNTFESIKAKNDVIQIILKKIRIFENKLDYEEKICRFEIANGINDIVMKVWKK